MTKKEYRETALYLRESLNPSEVAYTSRGICEDIIELDEYKQAENLCLYMHIHNEIILDTLMDAAFEDGKKVWLPKVSNKSSEENTMDFYRYQKGMKLINGAYNIPEPDSTEKLTPDDKTLIIMPGAVYSEDRKRIGYGGGYYDRYLSEHTMCHTIAVCFELQIFPDIPSDPHDIRPDMIVTEERIIKGE